MSYPLDPNNLPDGPSEYSWSAGLFPPGIANNEGQANSQDNFGDNMIPPQYEESANSNYARAVADRRTDPVDPDSQRDFTVAGLVDRYGPNHPLVKAPTQENRMSDEARQRHTPIKPPSPRAR